MGKWEGCARPEGTSLRYSGDVLIYLGILAGIALFMLVIAMIYIGFSGYPNIMFLRYEIAENYLYVRAFGVQAEKVALEEIPSVENHGFRWPGANFFSNAYVSNPSGVLRIRTVNGKSIYISPEDHDVFREQILARVGQKNDHQPIFMDRKSGTGSIRFRVFDRSAYAPGWVPLLRPVGGGVVCTASGLSSSSRSSTSPT